MAMKVYRLVADVNNFQGVTPVDMDAWADFALSVDCRPKKAAWKPMEVYIHEPMLLEGDFYGITPGFIVARDRAYSTVGEFLEMAGELLPMVHGKETLSLLNVTQCINCSTTQSRNL